MLAVTAALVMGILTQTAPESRAGALGGPVIIGGDDLTDHGGVDGGGNVVDGWLYIKNGLDSIRNDTSRGDGSIAALGSAPSMSSCCDAGAAIGEAASELGLTVDYFDGDTAINQFFADLGGAENPSIIWIAGDGASNDLDGAEAAALTANASAIASFVATGGGLFSHGSEFGWLTALLPGVTAVCCGSSDDLYFTPAGTSALGSLTVGDINAGPWHNHFEGNFGGLDVLVRSSDIQDAGGQDAAVILGGTSVTFEDRPLVGATEPAGGNCIPGLPGFNCGGQSGGRSSQPTVTTSQPSPDPAATATVGAPAPPTGPIGPGGGAGSGGITPPNTGHGAQSANDSTTMILALVAALAITGASLTFAARRIRS
jgi:hypothetical protein